MNLAVFPGTFDPITNGHIDIAQRAAQIFDQVVVAVYARPNKNIIFSTEQRTYIARESLRHIPNIRVDNFDILIVDYARKIGAKAMIKGLRVIADFEHEFQMSMMNRKLAPDIETMFLMTSQEYYYLSSSLVREVALLGGDVSGLVPPVVVEALRVRVDNLSDQERSSIKIVSLHE
ncbi:MAG: pantetheine-phosphate adenylyltransferase [Chloroflexi bacterium]|nr:pantetheine-phosphate adenylyltransferase [Chloroflexota bacterium]